MSVQTPRVSGEYVGNFIDSQVRIVARVEKIDIGRETDEIVVYSQGNLTVASNRQLTPTFKTGHYVELVAKVTPDLTLKALNATDFGPNFNIDAYDEVVIATHSQKKIFYDD